MTSGQRPGTHKVTRSSLKPRPNQSARSLMAQAARDAATNQTRQAKSAREATQPRSYG